MQLSELFWEYFNSAILAAHSICIPFKLFILSDLAFEHGVQSCVNTRASGVHKYKCRFEAYDGRYIEGLATAWVFGML